MKLESRLLRRNSSEVGHQTADTLVTWTRSVLTIGASLEPASSAASATARSSKLAHGD